MPVLRLAEDEAAGDLALLERGVGLVDFGERIRPGQQTIEIETPGPVQVDQAMQIDARTRRTVDRSLQGLLGVDELVHVDRGTSRGRSDPDDDTGASLARRIVGLLDRLWQAHGLEGEVDAESASQFAHRFDRVAVLRIDHVGRSETPGEFQLLRHRVDRDDLHGSGNACGLDDIQPDAAAAEDRDRVAGGHVARVEDRAESGDHSTSDQGGELQRKVLRDLHYRPLGHGRQFGEGRDTGIVKDLLAAGRMEARPAIRHPPGEAHRRPHVAERGASAEAVFADATRHPPDRNHVVAFHDRLDALSHRLDDARALVSEDDGHLHRLVTLHHVQVAVTDSRRVHPHLHLPASGGRYHHGLEPQRGVRLMKNGGLGFHTGIGIDREGRGKDFRRAMDADYPPQKRIRSLGSMNPLRGFPLVIAVTALIAVLYLSNSSRAQFHAKAEGMRAGVAKVDITPAEPIRMSGYASRTTPSEGIEQKLWAKAIAFGGPKTDSPRSVLLTVDSIGVPAEITKKVAEALAASHGIRRENVAICSTHTHTGPTLKKTLPFMFPSGKTTEEEEVIQHYTESLAERLISIAREACDNLNPARVSWGKGELNFAANRRVLENGTWKGFGVQADGPVDHSFPFLQVTTTEGELVAVLGNYACHCTTLGGDFNRIHGDWAGIAQAEIERRHPGATALVAIGCGADQNPEPRGALDMAVAHGEAFADEVDRMLQQELTSLTNPPSGTFREIALPLDPLPDRSLWEKQVAEQSKGHHFAKAILDQLDAGEALPTEVVYPIQTWTFGDELAMVFLGGEVVVDYAHRFYREFDADRLWVNAYANDVPCYIPTRRLYGEGGYEVDYSMVYYGFPTRLAPDTEDRIADEVLRQMPRAFYSEETEKLLPPPVEKEQALDTIQVPDGYRVELAVAEPHVQDPVDIAWDSHGRMWVVEMADYPTGVDGRPGGRVRIVDGVTKEGLVHDTTLFLDGLRHPNSVLPWRDGALVVVADRIFFARDTDGDGKADEQEDVVTGFDSGNSQHQLGGLEWGLDGWIHVANGGSKGTVRGRNGEELELGARDLRFRPDTGEVELVSGATQYGLTRDEWGNWFGCNNSKPFWHFALEDRYLRRNPHLSFPDPKHLLGDDPVAGPVFPISRTVTRFNDYDAANRFTSACGLRALADEWPREKGATHLFVAEPVHNLVSRRVLVPEGASFRAARFEGEEEREFLASTDHWFRPASIRTGPDGALYVVDMYRHVIEHPEWIPESWQRRLDLREGHDRGRIYRVLPEGSSRRTIPRLSALDPVELVAAFDTSNGTLRDLVHRELLWRNDETSLAPLADLSRSASIPAVRLQALATLGGLGAIDASLVLDALEDSHPAVRRYAVRLTEPFLDREKDILARTAELADDPDAFVRQQVAFSLGETKDPLAGTALAEILGDSEDPFLQAAALSSLVSHCAIVVKRLAGSWNQLDSATARAIAKTVVGCRDEEATATLLALPIEHGSLRILSDMVAAFEESGKPFAQVGDLSPPLAAALTRLDPLFEKAAVTASDPGRPLVERVAATAVLGGSRHGGERDGDLLLDLVRADSPSSLQNAAVGRIETLRHDGLVERALARFPELGNAARDDLIEAAFGRKTWTGMFLSAAEAHPEALRSLDASQRTTLLNHSDPDLRRRAGQLLLETNSDKSAELARFEASLTLPGDPDRGRVHFATLCATCHELEGTGFAIGPDLAALTNKSGPALLRSIVDPNAAVEGKYATTTLETIDGRIAAGIISSDTATSISLLGAGGVEQTFMRNQIETLQTTMFSPMPEGLGTALDEQSMADLLAYLGSAGSDSLVEPDESGSIRLTSSHANIEGPNANHDPDLDCINWVSEEDIVSWPRARIPAGEYAVFFHAGFARDPTASGAFRLSIGEEEFTGMVEETGDLRRMRKRQFAEITLASDQDNVPVRLHHTLARSEISIREIVLVPRL